MYMYKEGHFVKCFVWELLVDKLGENWKIKHQKSSLFALLLRFSTKLIIYPLKSFNFLNLAKKIPTSGEFFFKHGEGKRFIMKISSIYYTPPAACSIHYRILLSNKINKLWDLFLYNNKIGRKSAVLKKE